MRITEFLRKIGVLRSGSVAWKGDAAARPVAAGSDDFFGSNGDQRQGTGRDTAPAPPAGESSAVTKAGRQGKVLHRLALACGIVVLVVIAASGYFGAWFWANAVFWFGLTRYSKRVMEYTPYPLGKMISVLALAGLVSFLSLAAIPTQKMIPVAAPPLDPVNRVGLALDLENDLGLEDVRLTALGDGVLEVRTKAPVRVSPEAIYGASAYIFAYLQPRIPDSINTMRIILTVNDLDALFVESSRTDVAKWQAGKMEEKEYLGRLKTVNLGVAAGREEGPAAKPGPGSAGEGWHVEGLK